MPVSIGILAVPGLSAWCNQLSSLRTSYGSHFAGSTGNYDDSITHILRGNTELRLENYSSHNASKVYGGGHHEPSLLPGAVVSNKVTLGYPGVYRGDTTWVDAAGIVYRNRQKTFFPDTWTPEQIVKEIVEAAEEAQRAGRIVTGPSGTSFYGTSSSGMKITGHLDGTKVKSAYPDY